MIWAVPIITAVAYVCGLAVHELTHAAVVVVTGGRVRHVELSGQYAQVVYEHSTRRQDHLIRAAPAALFVPVVVSLVTVTRPTRWEWLYVLGFAAGYMPWSTSDWQGVAALLSA